MFLGLLLAYYAAFALANPLERRAATNVFPNPPTTSSLSAPITVAAGSTFNPPVAYTRYDRGRGACSEQAEGGSRDAVFILQEGATLRNVVIGKDQAEGIHCLGACRLENVFFEDVCEDAITLNHKSGTSYITGGGAKHSTDKVIQHNGEGRVVIDSFYAENFGTFYRSCGNCKTQHTRHVEIRNAWVVNGRTLTGVNSNYGDTATIRSTRVQNVNVICQRYNGNNWGGEPTGAGSGPDNRSCLYSTSDVYA
ncbi:pectate lyase C [Coprinopsis marcescibilis]|uniref:Pectate lyase n=1 Tax=Coprinopsis marcescibilis TaxID=230819 RepID=A0A5C3KSK0_COPMA|nr:pectate lyase C [Coprinopsis marcescibilis]